MSLNKKYCKLCNHTCHCVGVGYFVSTNQCDSCICEKCDCGVEILGAKESLWDKISKWFSK